MKKRALFLTLLTLIPVAAVAQTADEIVGKVIAARGGLEKIKAVKSERVTGTVTFAPGLEGPFVVELKRSLKMRMEITVDGQKIIRVYDGKANGWVLNPFMEKKDVQPMPADDLKTIADEADYDGPLVDYKAKRSQIEFIGKEVFDDKPVYRLKLTSSAGEVRFYVIDATTYLLVKWEGIRKSAGEELPWQSFFSDYREVNGIKYAFQTDAGSPGTNIKQSVTIEKIELDLPIDDTHFVKPTLPEPATPAAPSGAASIRKLSDANLYGHSS